MLDRKDKFFCDKCGGLQEAQKRMLVKVREDALSRDLCRCCRCSALMPYAAAAAYALPLCFQHRAMRCRRASCS